MTLVAAFSIEHVPVIVGDFLLTDEQFNKAHMFLPTNPQLVGEKPIKLGRRISGLRKKVHKVNDTFIIGFTGRIDDGQAIISKLYNAFSDSAPSLRQLSEVLSEYNNKTKGFTQIVGWTASKRPVCFSWSSNNDEGANRVTHAIVGSGAQAFEKSFSDVYASGISPEIKTAVERAQFAGVSDTCSILLEELRIGSAKNLESYYGFGAEIAYWDGAKFKFVPRVTMAFWNAKIIETGDLHLTPSNVLAVYQNFGDFSALQISHTGPKDGGGIEAKETWVTAITPMHDSMPYLNPSSIGRLGLEADFYFHAVGITDERMGHAGTFKLVTNHEGCSTFKFVSREGKGFFEVNLRELSEIAHSIFDPLAHEGDQKSSPH